MGSCLTENRNFLLYQRAYDERQARHSPGGQLLRRMIQDAVADGFATFDFAYGDDLYKQDICNRRLAPMRAIVPLSAQGRLRSAIDRGRLELRRLAKTNNGLPRRTADEPHPPAPISARIGPITSA